MIRIRWDRSQVAAGMVFLGVACCLLAGCAGDSPAPHDPEATFVYEPKGDKSAVANGRVTADLSPGRVVALVNAERARHRLPPLTIREELNAIARGHTVYQAASGQLTHRGPAGEGIDDRCNQAGVTWTRCGENVGRTSGYADPLALAVEAWMHSPGHRKNVLSKAYTETGASVMRSQRDGRWYFTQVFLKP